MGGEFPFKVEITPREAVSAAFGWLVDKFVHVEPHVCPRCPHGASEALDAQLAKPIPDPHHVMEGWVND